MKVYCNLHMKERITTLRKQEKVSSRKPGFLIDELNDHAEEPAIKRVEEILFLLVAADRLLRERDDFLRRLHSLLGRSDEGLSLIEKAWDSQRAYYQTLEFLNIKLSRYRWEATLEGDLDGFRSEIVPAMRTGKWDYSGRKKFDYAELRTYGEYTESFLAQRDQLLAQMGKPDPSGLAPGSWEYWEPLLVSHLLKAVDKGEISRYRRCSECQQWFYAIRGHQHFCGDACRRKHEAQSPAFKEKRARYMREKYRPDQKRKDERAKRQAGFKEKSKKGGK